MGEFISSHPGHRAASRRRPGHDRPGDPGAFHPEHDGSLFALYCRRKKDYHERKGDDLNEGGEVILAISGQFGVNHSGIIFLFSSP